MDMETSLQNLIAEFSKTILILSFQDYTLGHLLDVEYKFKFTSISAIDYIWFGKQKIKPKRQKDAYKG
jgi:hypothetical protein